MRVSYTCMCVRVFVCARVCACTHTCIEQKKHRLLSQQSFTLLEESSTKLQQQDGKLDDMTQSFMKLQMEAELSRLQGDILKRQVEELKGMLSEVKGYFQKFPMPPKEPERMLVMNNGGFMRMTDGDHAFETLTDICKEATIKWGAMSAVNMIGDLKQYTVALCYPIPADTGTICHTITRPGDDTCAFNLGLVHGTEVPRKITACQVCCCICVRVCV